SRARAIPCRRVGENVPDVVRPTPEPPDETPDAETPDAETPDAPGAADRTGRSARGMPRSRASNPQARTAGPQARSAATTSRPQNAGLSQPTAQPTRAWTGVIDRLSSCPWSGYPASVRRVSRAPSPTGRPPRAVTSASSASHRAGATSFGGSSSYPRSPVYPVRQTVTGCPCQVVSTNAR